MTNGMNRVTGASLSGWDHVVQSLEVIFTTRFNERVMREWFGSLVPTILGQTMIEKNLLKFFYSIGVAIEIWEPRFKLVKINVTKLDSTGSLSFSLDGEYFPDALIGNYTSNIRRSLILIAKQSGLVVSPFDGGFK